MKFSLFHNDRKTYKDELLLGLLILVWLACGGLLILFEPSFFFIESSVTVCFGVLLVLLGLMFIPGLIYRLRTNEKTEKLAKSAKIRYNKSNNGKS